MSEFSLPEVGKLMDERGLNGEQITALQRAAKEYAGKISKEELLVTFRSLGYIPRLLEDDLKARFGKKEEKPVRITYDLLPNGQVENFTVTPVTD